MALREVESNMAARRPSCILSEIVCDLHVPHMDLHNIIHIAGADPPPPLHANALVAGKDEKVEK